MGRGKTIGNHHRESLQNMVPRYGHTTKVHLSSSSTRQWPGGGHEQGHIGGIKARLGKCRKGWVDEIAGVLWAHRTTPRGSTQETPFSLVYGTEAVIPPELTISTERVISFDPAQNEEALRENLNLIEERREMAHIRQAENKRQIAKYYNKKVRPMTFKVGDHVWRKNEASRREDLGKLGPKWEGPYKVKETNGDGSYILTELDGYPVPRTWNAINLKRCYL
uniref:uncharacterized protein LOC122584465 n=1 Tax=Erigeron canadensis TaxID=72917 RepID=UPI001CB98060|nr:uncharacterized protein LOC122584465 [Erigeron canadensis]